tara:strand:+ start:13602 stop:14093 length:492 start_codon:yes stop_codon:yes gene_type:complete
MSSTTLIPNLPDHSRVWIYTSSREFTESEILEIEAVGKQFVETWRVHGSAMSAEFKIIYNRFVVIAADEQVAGVSGCGIDSTVALMKQIEEKYSVVLLDKLNLAFHSVQNTIEVLPMMEFQNKMDQGGIHSQTIVFNNLVETLGELRSSWEVPLKESWHKQLL